MFQAFEQIKIERDDIEQALSWYSRLRANQITNKDKESFERLLSATHRMRSLEIGDK